MSSKHRPVVFVHGYTSSAGVWDRMVSYAQQAGYKDQDLYSFDVDPKQSLVANAQALAKQVEELAGSSGGQVNIVAHSMGSLVTRQAVKMDGGTQNVRNFVSLGGPQRGRDVAEFVNSPAGSALKGSALVTNLPDDLDAGDPLSGMTPYVLFKGQVIAGDSSEVDPEGVEPKALDPKVAQQILEKLNS